MIVFFQNLFLCKRIILLFFFHDWKNLICKSKPFPVFRAQDYAILRERTAVMAACRESAAKLARAVNA